MVMRGENPFPDDPALEFARIFDFERTGQDSYRAQPFPSGLLRLFGGAIFAQCLAAAQQSIEDGKQLHSIHAYFQKPGFTDIPVDFDISRESDGRSFALRTVRMTQQGRPIMACLASFKAPERTASHSVAMPNVPAPEGLTALADILWANEEKMSERHKPFWLRRPAIDWRPVEPFLMHNDRSQSPVRHVWFRSNVSVPGGLETRQRLLAYASDQHIFVNAMWAMGIDWADDRLQTSSLDHAIWFHDDFSPDDWLLYALDSPASGNAMSLGRGNIFTRDGRLVATVVQQGLARILPEKREGKL